MKTMLIMIIAIAMLLLIGGIYEITVGKILDGTMHILMSTIAIILNFYFLKILKKTN